MIYHLSQYLTPIIPAFNVLHYVSVRSMGAFLTVFALSVLFGNWFIANSKLFFRAKARTHTPEHHKAKDDMPTMGGLFILGVTLVTVLLWCNLARPEVWIFLFCLIGFGAIGFWDDWNKIKYRRGISSSHKFWAQVGVAFIVVMFWQHNQPNTPIYFPFFKHIHPDLGLLFIPWAIFILVGVSNAVNLTDGLDGLAIGSLIPNFTTFGIICYLAGHAKFATYLAIPYTATTEIAIMGSALAGASLGFLWFNAYPAQIFMGDVGSLALGAGLGLMALMAKQELLLAIAGGLFLTETLSVIMQVIAYKYCAKRIFKMAPMHHHFELLGWAESKITTRFAIISIILCLITLMTLKIR